MGWKKIEKNGREAHPSGLKRSSPGIKKPGSAIAKNPSKNEMWKKKTQRGQSGEHSTNG